MRLPTILLTVAAASVAGCAQAETVEIRDAVARVTVVPESRTDIKVEVVSANPRLPLEIRTSAGRTIVDGDLDRKIRSCNGSGERTVVRVSGVGEIAWRDMPQVVVRTPRDVQIDAGGAVYGAIGRSASLDIGNSGCGDWTIANVAGDARVSQAGSGDTRMGSSGSLKIRVAGSGDVAAADVKGPLVVNIAGSGSAAVRSVGGPIDVGIAGSGDVDILGGRATTMKVSVAGSGDVRFDGVADSVSARIAGSGDVQVREVRGQVSKTVLGSGAVRVGNN